MQLQQQFEFEDQKGGESETTTHSKNDKAFRRHLIKNIEENVEEIFWQQESGND